MEICGADLEVNLLSAGDRTWWRRCRVAPSTFWRHRWGEAPASLRYLPGKPLIDGLDDGSAPVSSPPLGASFWRYQWTFSVVERRFIFCIDDDETWRHGAAGSQQRMRDNGCAQGGGVVWHHGDVDGRPGKVNTLITVLKIDQRKTVVAASIACASSVRWESAGLVCSWSAIGRLGWDLQF